MSLSLLLVLAIKMAAALLADRVFGEARRVQVRFGRSSVNTIEVLDGLSVGDTVILSDMSAWDAHDRIRLR